MAEKEKIKAGRKKGSTTKKSDFDRIVLSHIPKDMTHIQHKELMAHCVKSGEMVYQSMQDALGRLQTKGLIHKEKLQAIKEKRKAGSYYRRIQPSFGFYDEIPINGLNSLFQEAGFTPSEEALKRLWDESHITVSIWLWDELRAYAINPDKEQAKRRLNLVLTDIIAPKLMELAENINLTNKEYYDRILENETKKRNENIKEILKEVERQGRITKQQCIDYLEKYTIS
jgi:hypothetical protein